MSLREGDRVLLRMQGREARIEAVNEQGQTARVRAKDGDGGWMDAQVVDCDQLILLPRQRRIDVITPDMLVDYIRVQRSAEHILNWLREETP